MQIVIDIPDKEFGIDINDKFQDFFSRLKAEIKAHFITHTSLICGAYELETIDMFLEAFKNGTPLPKGHRDLIDRQALIDNGIKKGFCDWYDEIKYANTIIEADKEQEE